MEKIHLIAPGKYCGNQVIQNGVDLISSFGFEVEKGKNALGKSGYFSGTDEERTTDFLHAIKKPGSKVFFGRGGYGAIKVLELLPEEELIQKRPLIYGYSDATVFHLKMNQHQAVSVHCPMALDVPSLNDDSQLQLQKVLKQMPLEYIWSGHTLNREGAVNASLVGGNLAVIVSMMGSKHLPDFKGKILFIEEIGEALYAIDRMMMMLQLNGILKDLAGLMVGQFTAVGDSDPPFEKSVEQIILGYVDGYSFPVCFDVPVGHIGNHQSIYFGVSSQLEVKKEKTVLLQDPKKE